MGEAFTKEMNWVAASDTVAGGTLICMGYLLSELQLCKTGMLGVREDPIETCMAQACAFGEVHVI